MTTESGSAPLRAINPLSAIAIALVVTLGLLYVVSMFLRNSIGVIAPDLAAEIGLTPIDIGLLSSIYFFVFAATQLPLGVALDRLGPKLCMLGSIGFTVIGCVLFAVAHEAGGLIAEEAGAQVTNVSGGGDYISPPQSVVAAGPGIHARIVQELKAQSSD